MPRLIDETYLSPHPATLVWWERRAKCESCKFLLAKPSEPTMRCSLAPTKKTQRNWGTDYAYCIDERANSKGCGPKAKAWQAREGEPT